MIHRRRRKNARGLGTVELAAGAFGIMIMVIISLDVGVMMLANQVIDKAARDATRAAASQPDLATAIKAAQAALATHATDGTIISQPTLTGTAPPDFVYNDYSGTPPGQTIPAGFPNAGTTAGSPTVTCTVNATVLLPASLGVMGLQLDQGPLTGGKMTFRRTYSFPIVKQQLNSTYD